MPTLTPEQRKKWPAKTTNGGVPRGKKLCRCCVEDKPKSSFRRPNIYYCIECEQWYEDHRMKLRPEIDYTKYRREFIYDAF